MTTTQNINMPELRFPEFDGEWVIWMIFWTISGMGRDGIGDRIADGIADGITDGRDVACNVSTSPNTIILSETIFRFNA